MDSLQPYMLDADLLIGHFLTTIYFNKVYILFQP